MTVIDQPAVKPEQTTNELGHPDLAPTPSSPAQPVPHRWTFEQYMQISDACLPGRTELIDGEILDVSAQNNPHAAAISKMNRLLVATFDETYWLTIQSTVRLSSNDGPEPDFAVRPGAPSADPSVHPHPLLAVEVSDATLLYDQVVKSSLYAARGIADYWILNVKDRQLEVYRQPIEDATRRFGWRYGSLQVLRAGDTVTPLAKPDTKIEVGKMMP